MMEYGREDKFYVLKLTYNDGIPEYDKRNEYAQLRDIDIVSKFLFIPRVAKVLTCLFVFYYCYIAIKTNEVYKTTGGIIKLSWGWGNHEGTWSFTKCKQEDHHVFGSG